MATATLKPPPKFVANEWAWAYTLNKLADKGQLDDGGNPKNYAAAIAIYKRVAAKYGNPDATPAPPPTTMPALTRADLIALQARQWVVARGFAYTVTDQHAVRLFVNVHGWHVERIADDTSARTDTVEWGTVQWLLDHAPGVLAWAQEAGAA